MSKRSLAESDRVDLLGGLPCMDGLRAQWHEEDTVFCDAEISVGGRTFVAHRSVIAGTSEYFRRLYKSSFTDSRGPLVLHAIAPPLFEAILSWIYDGRCTLATQDDLVPLMEAADLLQILTLRDRAASAIATRLTEDSCVGAWQFATKYSHGGLEEGAMQACIKHWTTISSNPEILGSLTAPQMGALLRSDELPVTSEHAVVDALSLWFRNQPAAPSGEIMAPLVSAVRFSQLDEANIQRVAMQPFMQSVEAMKAALLSSKSSVKRLIFSHSLSCDEHDSSQTVVTWTIYNFMRAPERLCSHNFTHNGTVCKILMLPYVKSDTSSETWVALYLTVDDPDGLPQGWVFEVGALQFWIRSPKVRRGVVKKMVNVRLQSSTVDWGFKQMVDRRRLSDITFDGDRVIVSACLRQ